jgi:hypothetical protein
MKTSSVIGLIFLACMGGCVFHACRPVWQFDHLEQNARKSFTASELQMWATGLLADYPTNVDYLKRSQLGTNVPKNLLTLAPRTGPLIGIFSGYETNSPRYVKLYWGSGVLGAAGFEIGPTNFVSYQPGHVWAPGVYFYKR